MNTDSRIVVTLVLGGATSTSQKEFDIEVPAWRASVSQTDFEELATAGIRRPLAIAETE